MKNIRHLILAGGVAVCLIVLLFPPLRCPAPYYGQPELVGGTIGGHFEAAQIPRFSGFYGPNLTKLSSGAVVRTEIDPGELLRELALALILSGAAYFLLPVFVERAQQDAVERKLETQTTK